MSRFYMFKSVKTSVALKQSVISFALLLTVAVLVGAMSLFFYQRDVIETNAAAAQTIAETAAAGIDGDQYEQIAETLEVNDYWNEIKAFFDDVKTRTDAQYIYALNNDVDGKILYILDAEKPGDDPENLGALGDVEEAETYAKETFETLRTGKATISGVYNSGGYGSMVSGFAPVFNSAGQVVGVVGVDISFDTVMTSIWAFGLQIVVVALLASALCGIVIIWYTNKKVGVPIRRLSEASKRIAAGDIGIDVASDSLDEIGVLSNAFMSLVRSTRDQVGVLEHIAQGDFTQSIAVRSDKDTLNQSIESILENNNRLIRNIRLAARQVAEGSTQIAGGAQVLASGSTEQAASIDELTRTMQSVQKQAEENSAVADSAMDGARETSRLMDTSVQYMQQLTEAMQAINDSSNRISKVIKVIDDIAFQTNILALNAAVEAARAGQHGKGFAVVAEEVRSLASKSAVAAKETGELIETSIRCVDQGNAIAEQTGKSMTEVNRIASDSTDSMTRLSEASRRQSRDITEITQNIAQISTVVQANSATAEQSAAAAQEISAQAAMLNDSVSSFQLEESPGYPLLP